MPAGGEGGGVGAWLLSKVQKPVTGMMFWPVHGMGPACTLNGFRARLPERGYVASMLGPLRRSNLDTIVTGPKSREDGTTRSLVLANNAQGLW